MSFRLQKIISLLSVLMVFSLLACGSSSSNHSQSNVIEDIQKEDASILRGRFIDSPVEGLITLTEEGVKGLTDKDGFFLYRAGSNISFYLGDVYLGKTSGANIVTPENLTTTEQARNNMLRLMQSLDSDQNPENNIRLPKDLQSNSITKNNTNEQRTINFNLSEFEFSNEAIVLEFFNKSYLTKLVSEEEAVLHFNKALKIYKDAKSTESDNTSGKQVNFTGTVQYIDLEGGFYAVRTSEGSDLVGKLPAAFKVNGLSLSGTYTEIEIVTIFQYGINVEYSNLKKN